MTPHRSTPIAPWMVLSIAILGAVAVWDEQQESKAALLDFANEQATMARGVAAAVAARLEAATDGNPLEARIAETVRSVEDPGTSRVLFRAPGTADAAHPD